MTSTGRREDLVVVRALQESRVAGAHLERCLAGDVRGTPPPRPGLWVQELARVVGAVAESRSVKAGVTRLVELFCCVALHEQVDGHDACTLHQVEKRNTVNHHTRASKVILNFYASPEGSDLSQQKGDGSEGKGPAVLVGEKSLAALHPVQHLIIYAGDVEHQAHHQGQTCQTV